MMEIDFLQANWRKAKKDPENDRKREFTLSSYTRDRHRTVLNQKNWRLENFNKNPIVGYQHNVYGDDWCNEPNPDMVIGKGYAYMEGEELIGGVEFETEDINQLAAKIMKKVDFGSLNAVSVGFYPFGKGRYGEGDEAEGRENETFYYEGQELLEFSIVNIPSNPDAVARNAREQNSKVLLAIKRMLGLSFSEIESMTVRDVLGKLENRMPEQKKNELTKTFNPALHSSRVRELELLGIN